MTHLPVNHALIEQELVAIAKAVLHKERLKPKQSLFEQGLTSVGALEIRSRLENRFQIPLQTNTMFDYPTLAALTTFMVERLQSGKAKLADANSASTPPTATHVLSDAMVREILKKEFGV